MRALPRTRRNLVVTAPGHLEIREEELPELPAGGLLLETLATGLSAGTELTFLKGTNPALTSRWDAELGLFEASTGKGDASYPVTRVGYMECARVLASRTPAFREGERVAVPYGHATHHVCDPVRENVVRLPDDVENVLGTYVAHMGPICANGILHAAWAMAGPGARNLGDGVRGRRVLVTGAGLVGLLTALFARRCGAREVVVADADPRRREIVAALGLEAMELEPADPAQDLGRLLGERWRHGPGDHGADVAFQCRGRSEALHTALRALRPQGVLVELAFHTEGATGLRLGEEFHHNGLLLVSAQIGRVPRGMAADWDRARLAAETIALLRDDGAAVREHLVTDVVPFDEAPQLMQQLAARERHVLSAVFTMGA